MLKNIFQVTQVWMDESKVCGNKQGKKWRMKLAVHGVIDAVRMR